MVSNFSNKRGYDEKAIITAQFWTQQHMASRCNQEHHTKAPTLISLTLLLPGVSLR